MPDSMIEIPINAFWSSNAVQIKEIVDGLVHSTYLVTVGHERYILQKVNTFVFKEADKVLSNIQVVTAHLKNDRSFMLKVPQMRKTLKGEMSHSTRNDLWRCFYYIEGTTRKILSSLEEAREVARAFGQFSASLTSLSPDSLYFTIQGFHDPGARQAQFNRALAEGINDRIAECHQQIHFIKKHAFIASRIKHLDLPLKITHNDPKLSNVLFDTSGKPCAIIDLDTVMPGSPLHDFGDLVRSMAASVPEDHENGSNVYIKADVYAALEAGFMEGTGGTLTSQESANLSLGPAYIIYEQAMRFLADYLVGDIYYRIQTPKHNLIRANNQIALLRSFLEGIVDAKKIV